MRTYLKKAILILLLAVASVPCLAQQSGTVSFTYDENGNRTNRQMATAKNNKNKCDATDNMNTNVIDSFEKLSVSVYPNPTKDKVNISINNKSTETPVHLTVSTPTGAVLFDKFMADSFETIDLSNLSNGMYLIKLVVNNERKTWTVTKE